MPMDAPTASSAASATASSGRGQGGHRLAAAFDAVSRFPAQEESIRRVVGLAAEAASVGKLADAIEADPAVTVAVLRAANTIPEATGQVGSVQRAAELLTSAGVADLVAQLDSCGRFSPEPAWGATAERFRRHAVATRHAAEQIATLGEIGDPDLLVSAALLHDVGRLVIMRLYPSYPELVTDESLSPEQHALRERRELGVDHCVVGGVLARRWRLPKALCDAIATHHSDRAEGLGAAVRLADLVVHQARGTAVLPESLSSTAAACGLSDSMLEQLLYDFPHGGSSRPRHSEPSPLSPREVDALRGLGAGRVYKEIAAEMGLSTSTVRTHLHNVYRKIGAPDRAQAVLIARDRGWL